MGISASASATIQTGWNLSVSFEETGTSTPNNTSNIRCDARLAPANSYYMFDYYGAGTLAVYWHDNRTNSDTLVASVGVQTCSSSQNATTSGTITATHKADGTLSGYAKAVWTKGYNSGYIPATGSCSTATKALTNIPRKSKPTASPTSLSLPGTGTLTVTTNRAASSFTHTITLKVGDTTIAETTGVGADTTYDVADIQDAILAEMTTTTSATLTIICRTYSGSTDLGTEQTTVAVSVNEQAAPDFSDFTYADTNSTTATITGNNQVLISGKSTLTAYISAAQAATAKYSATMNSYTFTINAIGQSEPYATTAITKNLGFVTLPATTTENQATDLVVAAIDSRGNTTSVTKTITVLPYRAPLINASAARTNGFEDETTITVSGSASPLLVGGTGKNSVNATSGLQYRYKAQSTSTWGSWTNITTTYDATTGSVSASSFKINLDNQTAYDIEFKLTDALETTTESITVSQGQPNFYIGTDGRVSVGGMPTLNKDSGKLGQFEVLGNAYANGKRLLTEGEGGYGANFPVGTILPYSGSDLPEGYLLCDGAAVSRSFYSALFNVIGTTYGAGDGSTTFNVPDLKGKVAVGQDTGDTTFDTLGETGGEKTHTLTTTEMPSHRHKLRRDGGGVEVGISGGGASGNAFAGTWSTTNIYSGSVQAESIGGGGAHNNLQPFIVVKYIIKFEESAGTIAEVRDGYTTSTTDVYSAHYVNEVVPTKTSDLTNDGATGASTYAETADVVKKLDIASIDLTGQTTTILALTKALGAAGTDYARWESRTDGGSSAISDKPTGSTNASFVCEARCSRWAANNDYRYQLMCWVQQDTNPYVAYVANGSTGITWSRLGGGSGGGTFTTLWTNSNTNTGFANTTVTIANLSTYTFIDILVIPYRLGNQNTIHVVRHYYDATRTRGEISQPFRYNNARFYGSRIFTVNAGNVAFDYAYNDANARADDWYIPWKIIGYK